jgi:hypothetical protein
MAETKATNTDASTGSSRVATLARKKQPLLLLLLLLLRLVLLRLLGLLLGLRRKSQRRGRGPGRRVGADQRSRREGNTSQVASASATSEAVRGLVEVKDSR